ncbi:desulfoferrodoxin family protein [Candidatus Margulisiibacteriota bacterium]
MSISNYLKTKDEGQEKHCPDIKVKDCATCGGLSVTIQVGKEVMHPSTAEHSIKTIILYGVTANNKIEQLTAFQLGDENTIPRVRTTVKTEKYTKLVAAIYCNLHGLWENEVIL